MIPSYNTSPGCVRQVFRNGRDRRASEEDEEGQGGVEGQQGRHQVAQEYFQRNFQGEGARPDLILSFRVEEELRGTGVRCGFDVEFKKLKKALKAAKEAKVKGKVSEGGAGSVAAEGKKMEREREREKYP
eukprot:1331989-Amorphochlora_amoeboformis.AAC.2